MEFSNFKSFRLFWLPVALFYFFFFLPVPLEYYKADGVIHGLRGMLSLLGITGCVFYAAGVKFLTQNIWKAVFILVLLDESFTMYESSGYDLETLLSLAPLFIMLGLYSFHNKTIWKQHLTSSSSKDAQSAPLS